jgi:hypothetical protein
MIEVDFQFPADDFDRPDEPWFIEAKDSDPRDEFARQSAFVNHMRKHSPAIVYAVPNGGRLSPWQKIRRWREGAVDGALDLEIKWLPTKGERGLFVAEFKDGRKVPDKAQRVMLNGLFRAGVPCGVYRNAETLVAHLRAAGCPFHNLEARAIGEIVEPIVGDLLNRLEVRR